MSTDFKFFVEELLGQFSAICRSYDTIINAFEDTIPCVTGDSPNIFKSNVETVGSLVDALGDDYTLAIGAKAGLILDELNDLAATFRTLQTVQSRLEKQCFRTSLPVEWFEMFANGPFRALVSTGANSREFDHFIAAIDQEIRFLEDEASEACDIIRAKVTHIEDRIRLFLNKGGEQ